MKIKANFLLVFILNLLLLSTCLANSVLVVGDSHSVGPFGQELDRILRENSKISEVSTYASCGSIAKWWRNGQATSCGYWQRENGGKPISLQKAETPNFETLLEKHRPQFVVIELSGNYFRLNQDFAIADMKQMAQTVSSSGAKCLWVTTPHTRKDAERIDDLIKSVKESVSTFCSVFESHLVTQYPQLGGDGIHYWFPAGIPIAKNWAKKVSEEVDRLISE